MRETVLGLWIGQFPAYAAIANVLLAFVLAAVTLYYAAHAKRQADASKEQVDASNRQADAAMKTLDLLLKEKEQQARLDVFTVRLQLRAASKMIEEWQDRIAAAFPELPDEIEVLPESFQGTISNAERIDHMVAGYMASAHHFVARAELDVRVMRDRDPRLNGAPANPQAMEAWTRLREKAGVHLSTAQAKIAEASARLEAATAGGSPQSAG